MEIIRNLARRKLRSFLTISGIVIGIFALTTMGSMAEHFNALLDGGAKYFASNVQIGPPDGQQAALLPLSKMDELKKVQGVDAVYPSYSVPLKPGGGFVSFGVPDTIGNNNPGEGSRILLKTSLAKGRDLTADSRGEVVLGTSVANELKKNVGDTVYLPVKPADAKPGFVNHPFKVVGILNRTGTAPDNFATVSNADARMLVKDSLPTAIRNSIDVNQISMGFTVYAKPGASVSQLDALAKRINDQVPGVKATKPSDLVNAFKASGAVFTAITTGAALLALVIGGLSVVNTMIMAVTERVREIGLKKAVGAHTVHILREFMLEATLIGLIGGLIGYALGVGLANLLDAAGRASNLDLFLITPTLTILALGFAIVLGALAGVIPAFRAARLDPVTALRTTN
jgi:putative ABC transport system permease protein